MDVEETAGADVPETIGRELLLAVLDGGAAVAVEPTGPLTAGAVAVCEKDSTGLPPVPWKDDEEC